MLTPDTTADRIIDLCYQSSLVYQNSPVLDLADPSRCHFIEDAATDTQALAIAHDDHVAIAFRGTEKLKDWLTNVRVRRIDNRALDPVLQIHRGFSMAYAAIASQIEKIAAYYKLPVCLTGHSLGGALASVAYCHLHMVGHDVQMLATFGQPRVFSPAPRYHPLQIGNVYRFASDRDIVPHSPPRAIGYRHFNQTLCLHKHGLTVNPHPFVWGWQYLIEYLASVIKPGFQVAEHHEISLYLKRLQDNLQLLVSYIEGAGEW